MARLKGDPDGYCFTHSKENKAERLKAIQKGGRALKKPLYVPKELDDVHSLQDLAALLNATWQEVRKGEIPPSISQAITSISGQFIKLYEVLSLEDRLRKLEDHLSEEELD
jgi:hypothetical protein